MSEGTVLMSAEEIDRALSRIAHQVLEKTGGSRELALVGIHTRGVPLARRLAWKIGQAGEEVPPVGILDINMYRDDLSSTEVHPVVRRTELPFNVTERQIVLVDDVLFTGRTIRSAMDGIMDLGRPRAIRLAVLIDRGGRELPIQSDFVGRTFTVQPDQVVEVRLAEIDGGPDLVTLRSRADIAAEIAAHKAELKAAREAAAMRATKPVAGPAAKAKGRKKATKKGAPKGRRKGAGR